MQLSKIKYNLLEMEAYVFISATTCFLVLSILRGNYIVNWIMKVKQAVLFYQLFGTTQGGQRQWQPKNMDIWPPKSPNAVTTNNNHQDLSH